MTERADASQLPEHVAANRAHWDGMAADWVEAGERRWASDEPYWGIWLWPEAELGLLPGDMRGSRAIELGCGTAYVSAWMARRGAEVVGIDNSARQLETAARLAREHEATLTLLHGNAERVPEEDGAFDFAISEYGAAIWCDPHQWVPEAHRLLKPKGRLTFLGSHPLAAVTAPADGAPCDERLHRPYLGLHRIDWRDAAIDPGGIEFNLSVSAWLSLFDDTGFDVLRYRELGAPDGPGKDCSYVTRAWAQRWPTEQVWELQKRP